MTLVNLTCSKALDLFFNKNKTNFLEDFNKERLQEVRQESVKGKQFIKIQIAFLNLLGITYFTRKIYSF